MKADAAWQSLEAKVAGTDHEYKDCVVTPLIAVQPAGSCPPGADPACMLPAEVSGGAEGGWGVEGQDSGSGRVGSLMRDGRDARLMLRILAGCMHVMSH